jgi:hypothetical protein
LRRMAQYLIPCLNTQGAARARSAMPLATEGTQEGTDSPDERGWWERAVKRAGIIDYILNNYAATIASCGINISQ